MSDTGRRMDSRCIECGRPHNNGGGFMRTWCDVCCTADEEDQRASLADLRAERHERRAFIRKAQP